jgi:hypothetical protein
LDAIIDEKVAEFLEEAADHSGITFDETDSDDDDMGHIVRSK